MSISKLFPPQTGRYIVKVKQGDDWKAFKKVRLQISVGQAYHEADKFLATCEWAAARFPAQQIVCVNDTLQRYNAMASRGMPEDWAEKITRQQGDQWLKRNERALKLLPNVKIERWDDWRGQSNFTSVLEGVKIAVESYQPLKNAIGKAANDFAARNAPSNATAAAELSHQYLLEETAVFNLQALQHGDVLDVYPGTFLSVWDVARQNPISGLEGLSQRKWARIDFLKNKSAASAENSTKPSPQHLITQQRFPSIWG